VYIDITRFLNAMQMTLKRIKSRGVKHFKTTNLIAHWKLLDFFIFNENNDIH